MGAQVDSGEVVGALLCCFMGEPARKGKGEVELCFLDFVGWTRNARSGACADMLNTDRVRSSSLELLHVRYSRE